MINLNAKMRGAKIRNILLAGAVAGLFAGGFSVAQTGPQNLDQLLEQVRKGSQEAAERNKQRETEFRNARNEQAALLQRAKAELDGLQAAGKKLELQFQDGEARLAELNQALAERQGTLGELFGIVRQVAGDTRGIVEESLISGQLKGRAKPLEALAQSKELPSIEQLEQLWYLIQQEMTETGRVAKYDATVVTLNGEQKTTPVVRIGPFNALTEDGYLSYDPAGNKYVEIGRQPESRFTDLLSGFHGAAAGFADVAVDPSRGQLLSLLIQVPDFKERLDQGGTVGYVIVGIFFVGIALALERILVLSAVGAKVRAQMKSRQINKNNPLGRVLAVYEENRSADVETLELKLDEAILKEIPKLERGISTIKVFAAIAPLLGLLGTVTGMIKTFQAITLFGSGDPKLMAGGISEALVTTVEGLVTAIPMVLVYAICSGRAKSVISILEEQSAGLIAQRADEENARDRAA